jgi:hypothetical protein
MMIMMVMISVVHSCDEMIPTLYKDAVSNTEIIHQLKWILTIGFQERLRKN